MYPSSLLSTNRKVPLTNTSLFPTLTFQSSPPKSSFTAVQIPTEMQLRETANVQSVPFTGQSHSNSKVFRES